jgi:antitoxin ParD1/3/4
MPSSEETTVTLPAFEVERIDALVKSGAYSSAGEVVHEALAALEERNVTMDKWLREEVVPVYDAYQADPSRGLTAEEVFNALRAHHDTRKQKSA